MAVAYFSTGAVSPVSDQLIDAIDSIPDIPVILAGLTIPYWSGWLFAISEALAVTAQLLAVVLAGYKLWRAATKREARGEAAHGFASAASVAAKKGAGASSSIALGAVAILGALAAASWILAPKKDSPPLAIMAPAAAPTRPKKSTDDAGDDGDVPETAAVDGAPPWLVTAESLHGQHEGTKRRPNPVVKKVMADAGFAKFSAAETAWCAAFVGACLERNGYPSAKTLSARGYLKWGVALEKPRPGCIVVLWRVSPKSWQGHVGFYVREDSKYVYIRGGNQSDSVSIARFAKSRVLGYRWPRKPHQLKTNIAGGVAAGSAASAAAAQAVGQAVDAAPASDIVPTIQAVQEPLNQLAAYCKWAGLAAALLGLGAALYVIYVRTKDFKNDGL